MNITRDEARRIAGLAHLEFDEASLDRLASEMTAILAYIDRLREVDVSEMADDGGCLPTPFREDTMLPSADREAVAQNAPAFEDGFFVVPKVIE
jgi:aspartyl-tRNA(Asn)/glutamyl-tRNA(Gln) amidotransferase subunit C